MSRNIILYNIVTVLANWQPGIYAKALQHTIISASAVCSVCMHASEWVQVRKARKLFLLAKLTVLKPHHFQQLVALWK